MAKRKSNTKKKKVTVKVTPIDDPKNLPDFMQEEDAFTPITEHNAEVELFRRLCIGYGESQNIEIGCAFCLVQMRCLNVMKLAIPAKIEHFRQTQYGGKSFYGEAVEQATEQRVVEVIGYALEDIGGYQEDEDPLTKDRLLNLLSILSKEELKNEDPRIPILLFERLKREEDLTVVGEGKTATYQLKSKLPF